MRLGYLFSYFNCFSLRNCQWSIFKPKEQKPQMLFENCNNYNCISVFFNTCSLTLLSCLSQATSTQYLKSFEKFSVYFLQFFQHRSRTVSHLYFDRLLSLIFLTFFFIAGAFFLGVLFSKFKLYQG